MANVNIKDFISVLRRSLRSDQIRSETSPQNNFPSKVSHKRQVFQSWCSDPNSKRVVVVIFENSEIIKIRMLNRKSRIRQNTSLKQPSKWPKLDIANLLRRFDNWKFSPNWSDVHKRKQISFVAFGCNGKCEDLEEHYVVVGVTELWQESLEVNLCRLKKTQMIYLYKRAAKKILREPKEKNCFAKVTKDNMIQRKWSTFYHIFQFFSQDQCNACIYHWLKAVNSSSLASHSASDNSINAPINSQTKHALFGVLSACRYNKISKS